jgi:hypothetical protein
MLVGILGLAPAAHAQAQGDGLEPTVEAVGCAAWGLNSTDYSCPLTRLPNGDPTQADLILFESIAIFPAMEKVLERPYWANFELEGYVGSSQSTIDNATGVVTVYVYLYNSESTVYHVVRHKQFYPSVCGYCSAPAGFEESATYLGFGIYNL